MSCVFKSNADSFKKQTKIQFDEYLLYPKGIHNGVKIYTHVIMVIIFRPNASIFSGRKYIIDMTIIDTDTNVH